MPAATTVAAYGGIDLHSKAELAERIQRYIDRINQDPVVYRWRYCMEEIAIA
ncbi:MAG: hypothetical protein J5I81_14355 [Nitrococcus mobilis]|nr:hypothetical protein [Nitrococcus mobilis]